MTTAWIHVGLPKTGTTTLQHSFFPTLDGIAYLGPKGAAAGPETTSLQTAVAALKVRGDRPGVVGWVREELDARLSLLRTGDRPFLISEEGFSLTPPGAGFDRLAVLPAALRAAMGGPAQIVMVVRDPVELAVSIYEQILWAGDPYWVRSTFATAGPPAFDRFVAREHERFAHGAPDTIFGGVLRFDRVRDAYADAFGPENVHVLPYEPMRDDPERFCAAWCRLLGIPVQTPGLTFHNRSSSPRRARILKRHGIPPRDPRAAAFLDQFHTIVETARANPLLGDAAARHCAGVRDAAAARMKALTGLASAPPPRPRQ